MDSKLIRSKFLDFFASKGHQIVPSAPMVLQNDPTLMFTNAGMNQFKDYFLGNAEPKHTRVADTQKCLRVSGKHNDLEEVGIDTYHHTMFEMLGNWSFGDYFKKDAIAWAWELLTEVYGLPKERLYVTVFGGDKGDGLAKDLEAFDFWKEWIDEDRILDGSKKDNFWEMGETGPCGPCSEIHIDLRPQSEIDQQPGHKLVNQDDPQVVEIWNLVFIQFNRMSSGDLSKLPAQHIDTGMGFERLAMAIQAKKSNYDTDVFGQTIHHIAQKANVEYGKDHKTDIAIRVIVDHIRAVAFAISDGQLPSNNKAGYVIRRILRRAVRYGYTFLGFKEPFMYELVPLLANQFKDVFQEVSEQRDFIAKVIIEEESSFLNTLENGLKRLENIKKTSSSEQRIDGATAFELYDTYGFPLDLTQLIARENGMNVDEQGFEAEMAQQKSRSKKAAEVSKGDWVEVLDAKPQFIGYDHLSTSARIVKYREVEEKKKTLYQIVLDQTPFYAESGGQVGDGGVLEVDGKKISVIDTKKENDLIIHLTKEIPVNLDSLLYCKVNTIKRNLTTNNHSATHLLHAALRQVLGDHVQQKGSLVNEKVLRFDFSHFSKMTDEEIENVEKIVNQKVRENIVLDEKRNVPIERAKQLGAMALFGEKYGEFVRVITFDSKYSVELCGGTHVTSTGQIGNFKIVSESSVAAGVRRIEAITAEEADRYFVEQEKLVSQVKELLKHPKDVIKTIDLLIKERSDLQKQIETYQAEKAGLLKQKLIKSVKEKQGINVVLERVEIESADSLKKISFELRNEINTLVLVLVANINEKPIISIMFSENLISEKGLHAGQWVKELSKLIKGGGGGQPFYATAGGKRCVWYRGSTGSS